MNTGSSENRKPILVTGSHRSGTTWIGKMLSINEEIAYIHEPFNIKYGVVRELFDNWFQYISEENAAVHSSKITKLLQYKYPLRQQLKQAPFLPSIGNKLVFGMHKLRHRRPLIKDPLAILSCEWLQKTYNMDVLITVRHPAAFYSSLKVKNWNFDFNNLSNQTHALNTILSPYSELIVQYSKNPPNLIDQSILIWNIIHSLINKWKIKHHDWVIIRHEDISRDPLNTFKSLYKNFNLDFNQTVRKNILSTSGSHNPSEQTPGKEFTRNSKANIFNWKKRLSESEIKNIRDKTEETATKFYSKSDW
jgi:hypothetical protein